LTTGGADTQRINTGLGKTRWHARNEEGPRLRPAGNLATITGANGSTEMRGYDTDSMSGLSF